MPIKVQEYLSSFCEMIEMSFFCILFLFVLPNIASKFSIYCVFNLFCNFVLGAISYLPFLELSNASTINDTLDYAEQVNLPSDIYFGNETYNVSYVSILILFCLLHILCIYTLG